MNDIILVMLSYTIIIFLGFFILGWLQAGFLMPFLKVKTSRGKKILVKIRKSTGTDFIAAELVEGKLLFKYNKEKKEIYKFSSGLYRAFNVNCVDIDGETYGVINASFEGVTSNDPTKNDYFISRALMKPIATLTKENIIIIMLIFSLLLLIFVAYKLNFVSSLLVAGKTVAGVNL